MNVIRQLAAAGSLSILLSAGPQQAQANALEQQEQSYLGAPLGAAGNDGVYFLGTAALVLSGVYLATRERKK